MPSISIYRPPAARRLDEQSAGCGPPPEQGSVPERHDDKCPSEESGHGLRKAAPSGISMFRSAISSIRSQSESVKCRQNDVRGNESDGKSGAPGNAGQGRQRRPDMKVYVPKARRLLLENPKPTPPPSRGTKPQSSPTDGVLDSSRDEDGNPCRKDGGHFDVKETKKGDENMAAVKNCTPDNPNCESNVKSCSVPPKRNDPGLPKRRSCNQSAYGETNSVSASPPKTGHSDLCKKKQTPDTKREVTHHVSPTSLWIEAQNEVLPQEAKAPNSSHQIPAPTDVNSGSDSSETNSLRGSLEKIYHPKKKEDASLKKKVDGAPINRDESDWESMFDDSGECLDPSLWEQLSSAVGSVTIEKPKSNYDPYKTKTLDMVSNEFPHVIEIYNFPPEFQTQDLMTVFSQFANSGFEIKWVDDTHALGIFSNSQIVSEVLALQHPFVKTRSLKDGTMLSKAKARRSAEHLLPYKPRPDTCTALARRLVSGALGVRLPTSREEREAERKILTQAREKKRLEAKQREEAWEGTFH